MAAAITLRVALVFLTVIGQSEEECGDVMIFGSADPTADGNAAKIALPDRRNSNCPTPRVGQLV